MDACIYNEIHISNVERNISGNVWLDQEYTKTCLPCQDLFF